MGKKRRRLHRERLAKKREELALAQNPSIATENSVALENLQKEKEAVEEAKVKREVKKSDSLVSKKETPKTPAKRTARRRTKK